MRWTTRAVCWDDDSQMSRALYVLAYLAGLAFLLLSGWWTLSKGTLDLRVAREWSLLSAMALQVVTIVTAVTLWRQVVAISTGSYMRWPSAALQVCVNLVGKYVPGKVWGFAARHKTLTEGGTTHRQAAGALALEQASLLSTACLMSVPAFAGLAATVPEYLGAAVVAVVVVIALITSSRWRSWIQEVLAIAPEQQLVSRMIGLYFVQWLLSGGCMVLIAHGLGVTLELKTAVILASAVPAAVVSGMLAVFAPGGIGVREGVIVLLCGPVIGAAPALACALALRIVATVRDIICAIAVPVLVRLEKRTQPGQAATGS